MGWVDSSLRDLAASQHGLVTRRQAAALGVPPDALRHRVEQGWLAPLSREVFRLAGTPGGDEMRAMAAVLDTVPPAALSHRAAAAWWELPGFALEAQPDVVVPRKGGPHRTRLSTLHYHLDLPLDQVMLSRGVPVTSPALTIFHLAAVVHPGRVERACDTAWARRLLDGATLHQLLGRLAARGRNGIRTMRNILEARPPDYTPPESGLEARYLQILQEAGLPVPRKQVWLGGRFPVGRVDFFWDDCSAGVELLSRRFHSSYLDVQGDADRVAALREAGVPILTVWDEEVWHRPWEAVERTRAFRFEALRSTSFRSLPDPSRAQITSDSS
jgi:hypothetical protein